MLIVLFEPISKTNEFQCYAWVYFNLIGREPILSPEAVGSNSTVMVTFFVVQSCGPLFYFKMKKLLVIHRKKLKLTLIIAPWNTHTYILI